MVFASTKSWSGRSGSSLYKIYIALCLRANQESIDNFRASDREVADKAAVTEKTVRSAIKILIEMNILYRVKTNSITNHYGLNKNFFQRSTVSSQHAGKILPILNNDAFCRTGLNPSGARIYSLLTINSQAKYVDISRTLGMGYSTVKREMPMLKENGLVIYKDGRWFAVPSSKSKMEKIAKKYGVYGKAEKRRIAHKQQRDKFISSTIWKIFETN